MPTVIDLPSIRDLPRDVEFDGFAGTAEEMTARLAKLDGVVYRIAYNDKRVVLYAEKTA